MYKIFMLCFLVGCLSACEPPLTRSEQLSIYRTRCLEYGYEPGTVEFADCVKEQEKHQEMLSLKEKKLELLHQQNELTRKEIQVKEKGVNHNRWKIEW